MAPIVCYRGLIPNILGAHLQRILQQEESSQLLKLKIQKEKGGARRWEKYLFSPSQALSKIMQNSGARKSEPYENCGPNASRKNREINVGA